MIPWNRNNPLVWMVGEVLPKLVGALLGALFLVLVLFGVPCGKMCDWFREAGRK